MRVWDMDKFTLLDIAKLMGPVRCASYSPNAEWVAVGLGGKNAKHKLSGKWVVLDADTLDLRFEPPHTRFERVADIKFSPDSQWVAVGNADNGVDVYSVPGYGNTNSNFKRVAKYGLSMMVTSDEGLQKRVSRRFCSFLPRSAAGPGVGAGT